MTKTTGNFTDFVSFSRASGGTYLDSDGLIKTAATNVPRVEYDASGNLKGLLIEEARTNLVTYSAASVANWPPTLATTTQLTGNYLGQFPGVLVATAGGTFHRIETSNTFSWTLGTPISFRAFYAVGTSGRARVTLRDNVAAAESSFTGLVGNLSTTSTAIGTFSNVQNIDWGGGVYELRATLTPSATTGNARLGIGPDSNTSGQDIIALGAQLEVGAFPTSYIPTSGATATRAADICSIATSAFGYNQGAGTIVVDIAEFKFGTSGFPRAVEIGNSSNNGERINVSVTAASGTYSAGLYTANVFQMGGALVSSVSSPFVPSKAALAYKTNDGAAAYGGVIKITDTSIDVVGTSYPRNTLKIGGGTTTSADQINGHIKSIRYFPRRLTNAQIQALTA